MYVCLCPQKYRILCCQNSSMVFNICTNVFTSRPSVWRQGTHCAHLAHFRFSYMKIAYFLLSSRSCVAKSCSTQHDKTQHDSTKHRTTHLVSCEKNTVNPLPEQNKTKNATQFFSAQWQLVCSFYFLACVQIHFCFYIFLFDFQTYKF